MSTVERTVRVAKPSVVPMEGNPRNKGISMGLGGPLEVNRINREEVTKEEWLQSRQEFEDHKNRENQEEEIIMNNEHHHDDHEVGVADNQDDNGTSNMRRHFP